MVIAIVAAPLLILAMLHLWQAKILGVDISIINPSDSFESIDYANRGRQITPYHAWKSEDSIRIPLRVQVRYRATAWEALLPKDEVRITFKISTKPSFVDSIALEHPDGTLRSEEMEIELPLTIYEKGGYANATLLLHRIPWATVPAPQLVELKVQLSVKGKRLLLFPAQFPKNRLLYKNIALHTGPDLGDLWLAIDPGTTATCLAAATSLQEITLAPSFGGTADGPGIIPSVLSIDKRYPYQKGETLQSLAEQENIVRVGYYAKNITDQEKNKKSDFESFHSIKKLLGYTDKKDIRFANGYTLPLDGSQLTQLLVRGMMRNFKKNIEGNQHAYAHLMDGKHFLPKRVAVAIPNNFTANKIQDVVNCFKDIGQFQEIRCIRESEAVLCYYVHHHEALHSSRRHLTDETVLVFDMGGATINVTVADAYTQVENKRTRYHIEIDAQLGYGVGGDTIDYCLARIFYDAINEYPQLAKANPFGEDGERQKQRDPGAHKRLKQEIRAVMEELKQILVQNANNVSRMYVLAPYEIEGAFQKHMGVTLTIDVDGPFYQNFKKTERGLALLENPWFLKLVLKPVEDAVDDIAEITDLRILNTVIFSGRSTLFPGIKEKVEAKLREKIRKLMPLRNLETIKLSTEALKTAVAEGSCLYAVSRNAIVLSRHRVTCHFGIKHTLSLAKGHFEFKKIIPIGTEMNGQKIAGEVEMYQDRFEYDNHKVEFYQVMGANPEKVLRNLEKHKYSRLDAITVDYPVEKIGMELWFDDTVKGYVQDSSSDQIRPNCRIATTHKDQEIANANDEHYTWIVE